MFDNRKIRANLALMALAFVGLTGFHGCFEDDEADPSVKIIQPANGSTVTGPNVLVKVKVGGFTLGDEDRISASGAMHGGHVHLYLDKPIGTDASATATLESEDTITLADVAKGNHYLKAQGVDEAHAPFAGAKDSISFTVQ